MRNIFEITEKGAFQQIAFTTCRPSCIHEQTSGEKFQYLTTDECNNS